MKISLGHPSGNQFFRHLAAAIFRADALESVATCVNWNPRNRAWLNGLIPARMRRELARRSFQDEWAGAMQTHVWLEAARLVGLRLKARYWVAHETGWCSVDAVYQDFDRWIARQLPSLNKLHGVNAVYAYEDAAESTFMAAKPLGLVCVYDLPIAYWETGRRLMMEEAVRLPAWAVTLGGGVKDSPAKLARKTRELELADLVITPSQFVADSLPDWARASKRVIVAPFGSPPATPATQARDGGPEERNGGTTEDVPERRSVGASDAGTAERQNDGCRNDGGAEGRRSERRNDGFGNDGGAEGRRDGATDAGTAERQNDGCRTSGLRSSDTLTSGPLATGLPSSGLPSSGLPAFQSSDPLPSDSSAIRTSDLRSSDPLTSGPLATSHPASTKRLRVLFTGSMGQRKGLGDLFAAMRLLKRDDVELVVMGALQAPMTFYRSEFADFTYEPGRPHAQVLELMRSCDVFCLPSIVEGRALVMQEAMSQGLPIIITPNTGGADLVCEAHEGGGTERRNDGGTEGRNDGTAEDGTVVAGATEDDGTTERRNVGCRNDGAERSDGGRKDGAEVAGTVERRNDGFRPSGLPVSGLRSSDTLTSDPLTTGLPSFGLPAFQSSEPPTSGSPAIRPSGLRSSDPPTSDPLATGHPASGLRSSDPLTSDPPASDNRPSGPPAYGRSATGFLVPIRSPEAIAEAIAWCADHRAEVAEMGRAARRKAATYTWEAYGDTVVDAIRGLIAERR